MNNKKLGTAFEREFVELLASCGFWVHFFTPNAQGSQPCDCIAVKNGKAYLIDCKTNAKKTFYYDRLEYNQVFAFDRWQKCGNSNRYIAVKYDNKVYMITFEKLASEGKVELNDGLLFEKQFSNY